jgi:protoheme IX farnesyltransferase
MGWFAIKPGLSWEILLLCILVAVWLPLHVWSLIITNREDYSQAGLSYFPISYDVKASVRVLLVFSLLLYTTSIALYFIGSFAWFYLLSANLQGVVMVYASSRLVISGAAGDAWRLYKLSAVPYLGLTFLVMYLDIWLLG